MVIKFYDVYKNVGDSEPCYITTSRNDAHDYISLNCDGMAEIRVRSVEVNYDIRRTNKKRN